MCVCIYIDKNVEYTNLNEDQTLNLMRPLIYKVEQHILNYKTNREHDRC